jgi:hypothetical protein
MRQSTGNLRQWLVAFCLVCAWAFLNGCTNYKTDHIKEWTAAFMIDSITAGAIRLEYVTESPTNNTLANGKTYSVSQSLYYYNFKNDSLTKMATLRESLEDPPIGTSFDFNYPYLAYETENIGTSATAIYDLTLKKNILVTPFMGFLSSQNKYLVKNNQLMNIETQATRPVLSGLASLFYYDDNTNSAFGQITALRSPPAPIIRIALIDSNVDTIGALKEWDVIARSHRNTQIIFRIYAPNIIGIVRGNSLLANKVLLDSLNIGETANYLKTIDFDSTSGNFVAVTNGYLIDQNIEPGLFIGNLKRMFPNKNISPNQ